MAASEEKVERIVGAVLRDEFVEAAEEYADTLLASERTGRVVNINALVRRRERFINLRAMMAAQR